MDSNIIKIDEEGLKNDLKGVIRKTIEETLNTMLDEEAAELCNAEKHERTDERKNYRSGHYQRSANWGLNSKTTGEGTGHWFDAKGAVAPWNPAIFRQYVRSSNLIQS